MPKIAKQSGVSFEFLIDWIVKDAKLINIKLIKILRFTKVGLILCILLFKFCLVATLEVIF